jgi:hypothetical protein
MRREAANSEVRQKDVFGVLKLTLRPDGYTWEFIPIEGQSFHGVPCGLTRANGSPR